MTDFAIGAAQNVGNRWGLLSLRSHRPFSRPALDEKYLQRGVTTADFANFLVSSPPAGADLLCMKRAAWRSSGP